MPGNDKTRAAPSGKTTRAVDDQDPDYRYPDRKVVQAALYVERQALGFNNVARAAIAKAQSLLLAHNLELRVWPQLPTVGGDGDIVFRCDSPTSSVFADDWRDAIVRAHEPADDVVPVVFCLGQAPEEAGWASVNTSPRYCHVYVNHPCADNIAMVHEIGHLAGNDHVSWDIDGPSKLYNFMATAAEFAPSGPDDKEAHRRLAMAKDPLYFRNCMRRYQVRRFAGASFCVRHSYFQSLFGAML